MLFLLLLEKLILLSFHRVCIVDDHNDHAGEDADLDDVFDDDHEYGGNKFAKQT